jgi:hypothetical protein
VNKTDVADFAECREKYGAYKKWAKIEQTAGREHQANAQRNY